MRCSFILIVGKKHCIPFTKIFCLFQYLIHQYIVSLVTGGDSEQREGRFIWLMDGWMDGLSTVERIIIIIRS